jgi:DNA-binding XRE family transcriptional regulator
LPDCVSWETLWTEVQEIGRILPRGGGVDEAGREALAALGASIRAARRDAGITQATLAELAGTSERTVRDIERGSPSPSVGAVVAAARAVGLTVGAS